jgi:putative transposase
MRSFEYRLYPTRDQRRALALCLVETRDAYNAMLTFTKAQYDRAKTFPRRYDLTKAFAGTAGARTPASTQQALAERLSKALAYFSKHRHERQPDGTPRVGFPRFKTPNSWHSICLRQHRADFRLSDDGRQLNVPKKLGGKIKLKRHRPVEGVPRRAYLVRRADGHWYVMIVCNETTARVAPAPGRDEAIGIDVGLRHFLTDSNGGTIGNPGYFRSALKRLRRKQRTLSRRQRSSHRRRKAARSVAQTHLKVARQRRDFHFKSAKKYVERYRLIAVEDLTIARMVHHPRLSKSILDAGWGAFLNILQDKAARAGSELLRVPARSTSQKCSRCNEASPKSLSARTHVCRHCGYVADRDHNAAQNILAAALQLRAGARPSGTVGCS